MLKLFHTNSKGDGHMIKFFADSSPQSLETKVNHWIEEHGTIEVLNMSYVILKEPSTMYHLALYYNDVTVDW